MVFSIHLACLLGVMALASVHAGSTRQYTVFVDKLKWSAALNKCQENGGTLAIPADKDENKAIQDLIKDSGKFLAWIGVKQGFVDAYGDVQSYTKWKKAPKSFCIVMKKTDGKWLGRKCNSQLPFVCQVDVPDPTTTPVPTTKAPTTAPETTEAPVEPTEAPPTEAPPTAAPPTEAPNSDCGEGGKYSFPLTGTHTACLEDSSDLVSKFEMADSVREHIVNEHNTLRAGVDPKSTMMMKMSWDAELEKTAQKWANSCPSGHDEGQHRFSPGRFHVGQNMYQRSQALAVDIFDAAMNGWWAEVSDYVYGTPYYSQTAVVGHYTQMAWSESYLVGCAATDCGYWKFVVCNYGAGGNMNNFLGPYEEADPESEQCSGCETCEDDGLCACDGLVCNSGTLNADTCTCTCGELSYQTEPDCELRCDGSDKWWCEPGGTGYFSNCAKTQILRECPHMCGICP